MGKGDYLNQKEAMQYLNCDAKTIWNLVKSGKLLQFVGFDRRMRLYRRGELDTLKKIVPISQKREKKC